MKSKQRPATVRKRSAEARAAWRLGHKVHKNPRVYSRKTKHRKPRPQDGVSFFLYIFISKLLNNSGLFVWTKTNRVVLGTRIFEFVLWWDVGDSKHMNS